MYSGGNFQLRNTRIREHQAYSHTYIKHSTKTHNRNAFVSDDALPGHCPYLPAPLPVIHLIYEILSKAIPAASHPLSAYPYGNTPDQDPLTPMSLTLSVLHS
ncbi:hypothetical protein D3C80_1480620 [compost metagenome]